MEKHKVSVFRKEHFNAAHRLYVKNWTDAQNEAVFGKCANANWHGHNYELFVTIKGEINPETGFVIDLKDLKKIKSLISYSKYKKRKNPSRAYIIL